MNDENFFIQLRDCFAAGYTLPQFCVENEIKKPLFLLADQNHWHFFWEIYVQFSHDKRIKPDFVFLTDGYKSISFAPGTIFDELKIKSSDEANLDDCDKIFFLTVQKSDLPLDKIIYLDELTQIFIRRAYMEIPILHFLQKNPKVKFFLTNFTIIAQSPDNTDWENQIIAERKPLRQITADLEKNPDAKTPYDFLGYTRQELLDILHLTGSKTLPDGSTVLLDNDNPLVRVKNGRRVVPNQPENFINRIYFMGGCSHLGVGAPFDKTIPSYLQAMLNEKNLPYRVENVSQFFTYRYQDIFYNLETLPLKDGDIIFVFFDNMLSDLLPKFDVSRTFFRPHNHGEVFVDNAHVNELGYKALAGEFFKMLTKNNFFQGVDFEYPPPPPIPHRYGIPRENFSSQNFSANKELEDFKQKLREKKIPVGAIVMNCNPFTLGHEYLIEYASKRVKKLFVFVVEEDRSDFKFADRIKLVREGTKKFSNVEVLPSGKFMISQQTFSGYFNKENLQDVAVDSSEDVEIFAREIAPTLGITVRFVGEEPEDSVTRQYNENMKKILPRYNIEFCEIPRREISGEVISAKKVREALKVGDFEKIKKLVPKSTLKFLRENFSEVI